MSLTRQIFFFLVVGTVAFAGSEGTAGVGTMSDLRLATHATTEQVAGKSDLLISAGFKEKARATVEAAKKLKEDAARKTQEAKDAAARKLREAKEAAARKAQQAKEAAARRMRAAQEAIARKAQEKARAAAEASRRTKDAAARKLREAKEVAARIAQEKARASAEVSRRAKDAAARKAQQAKEAIARQTQEKARAAAEASRRAKDAAARKLSGAKDAATRKALGVREAVARKAREAKEAAARKALEAREAAARRAAELKAAATRKTQEQAARAAQVMKQKLEQLRQSRAAEAGKQFIEKSLVKAPEIRSSPPPQGLVFSPAAPASTVTSPSNHAQSTPVVAKPGTVDLIGTVGKAVENVTGIPGDAVRKYSSGKTGKVAAEGVDAAVDHVVSPVLGIPETYHQIQEAIKKDGALGGAEVVTKKATVLVGAAAGAVSGVGAVQGAVATAATIEAGEQLLVEPSSNFLSKFDIKYGITKEGRAARESQRQAELLQRKVDEMNAAKAEAAAHPITPSSAFYAETPRPGAGTNSRGASQSPYSGITESIRPSQ